jgi:F-type H+-transporting ATPase subunit a
MSPALALLVLGLAQAPAPSPEPSLAPHESAVVAPEPPNEVPESAGHAAATESPAAAPGHGGATGEHAPEAGAGHAEEHGPAQVLMHHVLDQPWMGLPSKHLAFFVIAALLVIAVIQLALRGYKDGVPRGLAAFVETIVVFIRDEIAEKNIGHDGRKYVPLLLSFFFFILTAALLGLVPLPLYDAASGHWSIAATGPTANISITLGLAFVSFLAQQWAGISKFGVVKHFTGMVPHGLPWPLVIIMIPVEILGMFSKPFALMIRLFANMLAGHMVITTLLLLVPLMATASTAFGIAMLPVSLGLSLFIMMLEVLVAFIQAYIFTLLTSIFIGMYAHPAH